jgi:DNA-binding ferritin-like protein
MKANQIASCNTHSESERAASVEVLNRCLSDLMGLHLQVKQSHRALLRTNSAELHPLCEHAECTIDQCADEIITQVVRLGGNTSEIERAILSTSCIPIGTSAVPCIHVQLFEICRQLSRFTNSLRQGLQTTAEAHDFETCRTLTLAWFSAEKLFWLVEAHADVMSFAGVATKVADRTTISLRLDPAISPSEEHYVSNLMMGRATSLGNILNFAPEVHRRRITKGGGADLI